MPGLYDVRRKTSPDDSYAIIDRAIDAGINFLDTANVYSRGRSEEVTGEALKRNGKRQQIVLATKVHGTMDDDDPNAFGNCRRHIIEQCEASLRRLQTDYIDLYQIHRPRSDTPIDETLRALDDLIRAGKVRYIGTSTFAAWQVMESLWVSKELGLNRFVSEQPPYHILDRRIERELIPMAQTYGIGIIPWSPLAGGLLTGKYTRENPSPEGARYADVQGNQRFADRKTDELYDVVDELRRWRKTRAARWRNLRWRGSCTSRASPAPSSARARWSNWSTTWARWRWRSPTTTARPSTRWCRRGVWPRPSMRPTLARTSSAGSAV